MFPVDWSEYDLLRLDAHGEEVKQTIRVVLEDEEIGPPIVRNLTVEPGKWVTLEIDLRAAARERGLDLKRMATLAIGVTELDEKPKTRTPAHGLDRQPPPGPPENARQAAGGARSEPRTRCRRTIAPASRSRKNCRPGEPDRTPLKLEKPFLIPTEKAALVAPVGWAAAYDNQRLLLGFDAGATSTGHDHVLLLQSLDGGQTWRGLDGGDKPTPLYVFNPDHGSGRGDVVGHARTCCSSTTWVAQGPNIASLRLFARKLTFTGKGWEVRADAGPRRLRPAPLQLQPEHRAHRRTAGSGPPTAWSAGSAPTASTSATPTTTA